MYFQPVNFEKRWLSTSVGQPIKRHFLSESQQAVRWLSNQISSFKSEGHQTFMPNAQLAVRIYQFGRLFKVIFFIWKQQWKHCFADIWKAALAPFTTLPLHPCCYCHANELPRTKTIRTDIFIEEFLLFTGYIVKLLTKDVLVT